MEMKKEVIVPNNVHPAEGFSHAVKVGNTIYTSGQAGFDLEGKLVDQNDFNKQLEQALINLKNVLAAAGAKMSDIVRLALFVTDYSNVSKIDGEMWFKYLGPDLPPVTGVQVAGLHEGLLVEINAIAIICD